MKHIIEAGVTLSVAFLAAYTAKAELTYMMDDADLVYDGGHISTTGTLVFPGKTLADLEGYEFWGRFGGSYIGTGYVGLSDVADVYPANATGSEIERYDFDIKGQESANVKAVHIQLYNGDGGVYAKAMKAWNKSSTSASYYTGKYYTVDDDGTVTLKSGVNPSNIATDSNSAGYGIAILGVGRPVTTTSQLAFKGYSLADVSANLATRLSAKVSGSSCVGYFGKSFVFTNFVVTAGTEAAPTAIRCEAQFSAGQYIKCAVLQLTDGTDGIYAQLTGAYYKSGGSIGYQFLNADGTAVSGVGSMSNPSTLLAAGYGMYNLTLNPQIYIGPEYLFDENTYLTSTAQLVFRGATLSELEDCQFYGMMDGGFAGDGGIVNYNTYSQFVVRYPSDTSEAATKLFAQLSHLDDTYTKNCVVEMTQGEDGVYARNVLVSYGKKNLTGRQLFGVDSSGTATNYTSVSSQSMATRDHDDGYGIKAFGATKIVQSTATLAFPGLTVADIVRGKIIGKTCGASIARSDQYYDYTGCNRVIAMDDSGAVTNFYEEMQFQIEGATYNKAVVLKFTNGDGGVYVQPVKAVYLTAHHDTIGRRMMKFDGTSIEYGGNSSIATGGFWSNGYGIRSLAVLLPPEYDTGVATAVWNGGDPDLASSWTCRTGDGTLLEGAVPDEFSEVLITDDVTMTTDANLTKYATARTVYVDDTIDTAGHKLYLKALEPWRTTTITDTVGGGELHLVTPDGFMTYNEYVALSGSLKLVKEGDGLYMPNKRNQTYSGGTEIAGGIVKPSAYLDIRFWCFGGNGKTYASGQVVTVSEGGTLDLNGSAGLGYTTIVFNGGTVCGATTQFNCATELTTNSYLHATGDFTYQSSLAMNGNTLNVEMDSGKCLYLEGEPSGPGTFNITSDGCFSVTANDIYAPTVNFNVNAALEVSQVFCVSNYYAAYSSNVNSGSGTMKVYGTFTPATTYFYGCEMQDGSTIDLSAKTDTWSSTSSFTSGSTNMTFAANATVNVDIGDRTLASGTQLVSWPTEPENLGTLSFKCICTDAQARSLISLCKKSDGLYLWRGMILIVR